MSKEYPCVYFEKDGVCRKLSSDTDFQYCVMGPCPHETLSNADRIRAMSDEELAETLYGLQKEVCRFMAIRLKYPVEKLKFEENLPELIDWLKQPAEEST